MTGMSFAGRYWRSLSASQAAPEGPAGGRGRSGYSFWLRYWASFIGIVLPAAEEGADYARSLARFPSPSRYIRTLPKARLGPDGWLSLPELHGQAILHASDESPVIAEAATPDGRAEFFVRRGDPSKLYLLEVVLREFDDPPAIVLVRYTTTHGERVLAIPLASSEIGVPSAQIWLAEIDSSQPWEARGPVSAHQATELDAAIVAASVAAAANGATLEAWRRVSDSLGPDLQRAIGETMP